VERGHGTARDLERCEDGGVLAGANAADVSDRALERGLGQIGSLGSGNHFLEVQAVDTIYDASAAAHLGLEEGTVCVMIHTGSRGLGHQICTDHVRVMGNAMGRYGIHVPDRQLACVPVRSPEGQAYLAAMAAAANYGRANRQLLTEATRRVFEQHTATSLDLLYDVSHNLAKIEVHDVDGRPRSVCVHRKGATRSLPPRHPDLPADLAAIGQPVLIPGTMGTASYVLAGVPDNPAFFSTAHGAGRVQSRHQAAHRTSGDSLRRHLEAAGILVRGSSPRGLAEEKPEAYKDIDAVIEISHNAGLARKIARLVPLGVVKG
jgi:tRNA-splicing ligase RtcB